MELITPINDPYIITGFNSNHLCPHGYTATRTLSSNTKNLKATKQFQITNEYKPT